MLWQKTSGRMCWNMFQSCGSTTCTRLQTSCPIGWTISCYWNHCWICLRTKVQLVCSTFFLMCAQMGLLSSLHVFKEVFPFPNHEVHSQNTASGPAFWTYSPKPGAFPCHLGVARLMIFTVWKLFFPLRFHFVLTFLPCFPLLQWRIRLGKADQPQLTHYVKSARIRIALQAAAAAWRAGVPWAEALRICTKAVAKANPKAKAIPRFVQPKARARWHNKKISNCSGMILITNMIFIAII